MGPSQVSLCPENALGDPGVSGFLGFVSRTMDASQLGGAAMGEENRPAVYGSSAWHVRRRGPAKITAYVLILFFQVFNMIPNLFKKLVARGL